MPDVVLELEQSDAANERGHLVIAIENPNPDLAVKIVVRFWDWLSLFWQVVDFTVHLSCLFIQAT